MTNGLDWLLGRTTKSVEFLGRGSWRFRFGEKGEIQSYCPWRYILNGKIMLSSEDHGHEFGLPEPINAEVACAELLAMEVIAYGEIRADSRDIVLVFESGARLEIIPLSSGYESWEIRQSNGWGLTAQGGGNLVQWE